MNVKHSVVTIDDKDIIYLIIDVKESKSGKQLLAVYYGEDMDYGELQMFYTLNNIDLNRWKFLRKEFTKKDYEIIFNVIFNKDNLGDWGQFSDFDLFYGSVK